MKRLTGNLFNLAVLTFPCLLSSMNVEVSTTALGEVKVANGDCCICLAPLSAKPILALHQTEKELDKQHQIHASCAYLLARNTKSTSQCAIWELDGKEWKGKDKYDVATQVTVDCPLCKKAARFSAYAGLLALKKCEKDIMYFERLFTFDVSFPRLIKDVKKMFWILAVIDEEGFEELQKKYFGGNGQLSKRIQAMYDFFTKNIVINTEDYFSKLTLLHRRNNTLLERYLGMVRGALKDNDLEKQREVLVLAACWIDSYDEIKYFLKKFWLILLPEQRKLFLKRAYKFAATDMQKQKLEQFKLEAGDEK